MTTPSSYANVLCDLVVFTEDESYEFLANLDACIIAGERRLLDDLGIDLIKAEYAVGNTTAHVRTLAIPAGIVRTDSLYVTVAGSPVYLLRRNYEYIRLAYGATEGQPKLWDAYDTDNYSFGPTPDAAYAVTAFGLIKPSGLSSANPTTWLSTYFPDILLKACLIESEQYLTNPTQVSVWKADYASRLPKVQADVMRLRAA